MKILGIDPATELFGWAILELKDGDPQPFHIDSGEIKAGGATLEARLRSLGWHIGRITKTHKPNHLALEGGYVGGGNRATLVLAEARGVCILATGRIKVFRYAPSTVKKAATGNGRADKWMVCRCVQVQLGLPSEPLENQGDAIAVALTHANRIV